MKKIRKIFLLFLFSYFGSVSAHNIEIEWGRMSKTGNDALVGISITSSGNTNGTSTDLGGDLHLSVSANAPRSFFQDIEASGFIEVGYHEDIVRNVSVAKINELQRSMNYDYLKHII